MWAGHGPCPTLIDARLILDLRLTRELNVNPSYEAADLYLIGHSGGASTKYGEYSTLYPMVLLPNTIIRVETAYPDADGAKMEQGYQALVVVPDV